MQQTFDLGYINVHSMGSFYTYSLYSIFATHTHTQIPCTCTHHPTRAPRNSNKTLGETPRIVARWFAVAHSTATHQLSEVGCARAISRAASSAHRSIQPSGCMQLRGNEPEYCEADLLHTVGRPYILYRRLYTELICALCHPLFIVYTYIYISICSVDLTTSPSRDSLALVRQCAHCICLAFSLAFAIRMELVYWCGGGGVTRRALTSLHIHDVSARAFAEPL